MKKTLSLLLASLYIATFACGCAKDNKEYSSFEGTKVSGEPVAFEKTGYLLVDNRESSYKIVVPNEASKTETIAGEELQNFIKKATSCTLPIISDSQVERVEEGKYLFVGKTKQILTQDSITLDVDVMGQSGASIDTIADDVYMSGADEIGTLNSVYKFLQYQVGYQAYAVDCVKVNYSPSLNLLDFDYHFIPSVDMHAKESYYLNDIIGAMRMGMVGWNSTYQSSATLEGNQWAQWCHTTAFVIPESSYKDKHPEWFNSGQLCYTNQELIKEFAKNLSTTYAIQSESWFMVGGADNHGYCKCANCEEAYKLYGGQSGVFVRFLNAVADELEVFYQENAINKEFYLIGLMYASYENPPVIKDGKGNYIPTHESVVCDTEGQVKVGAQLSPLHNCSYHSYTDSDCEINVYYAQCLQGWDAVTDNLSIYTHNANWTDNLIFYPDWYALSEQIKFYNECDIEWMLDAGEYGRQPLSDLRTYVRRQISWDKEKNIEECIDDFMIGYYGKANVYMKQFFNAMQDRINATNILRGVLCTDTYAVHGNSVYWTLESLHSLATILESAMQCIERSDIPQNDKEVYTERIYREYCIIRLTEYKLFINVLDEETKAELEIIKQAAEKYYINETV